MVNHEEQLNRIFRALADPTRREILNRIATQDATVGELSEPFNISAPAISRHLKTLESATLITRTKKGKTHRFKLNTQPLYHAETTIKQLTSYWMQRLTNLETFLDKNQNI